jgi:hypothetical protein
MSTKPEKAKTEAKQDLPRVRVSKVTIEGFKAFKDPFTLEIPPPLAQDDMDVFVLGSVNGVGKTTVLEGICLGMLRGLAHPVDQATRTMLINSSKESADIWLDTDIGGERSRHRVEVLPGVGLATGGASKAVHELFRQSASVLAEARARALAVMAGRGSDPIVAPPILYFHSYRKVASGPMETASLMVQPDQEHADEKIGAFKRAVLEAMLARADLLEGTQTVESAGPTLGKLDDLLAQFAGVHVGKLAKAGKGLELRVTSEPDGPSLPFDALSSGQKEIISTLFLIWEATRDCPSVVLIDEPELHLHGEWHSTVIRMLWELAAWNQYILATHSGEVARSVEPDRVFIIEP